MYLCDFLKMAKQSHIRLYKKNYGAKAKQKQTMSRIHGFNSKKIQTLSQLDGFMITENPYDFCRDTALTITTTSSCDQHNIA